MGKEIRHFQRASNHYRFNDLTGKVFNRLTVQSILSERSKVGIIRWLCKCNCGKEVIVLAPNLTTGHTKSCGCFQNEQIKERSVTHGLTRTSEYQIWNAIIARCENTKCVAYKDYGGRGILMCKRWRKSFVNFIEDMGSRPSKSHTIDRIDNNKGYSKSNCKWATMKEQARNRRSTTYFTINGIKKSLSEWCEIHNMNYHLVVGRYKRGWTIENALTAPLVSHGHKLNTIV